MHLFLRKLLKTALILVALLIVAGFVTQACVQSQWYRAKLERRLGEALEMDVKIASIAMEWPCSAVLTDVQGKASGSSAEIKVKEIRGTFLSSALSIVQPIVRLSKGVPRRSAASPARWTLTSRFQTSSAPCCTPSDGESTRSAPPRSW